MKQQNFIVEKGYDIEQHYEEILLYYAKVLIERGHHKKPYFEREIAHQYIDSKLSHIPEEARIDLKKWVQENKTNFAEEALNLHEEITLQKELHDLIDIMRPDDIPSEDFQEKIQADLDTRVETIQSSEEKLVGAPIETLKQKKEIFLLQLKQMVADANKEHIKDTNVIKAKIALLIAGDDSNIKEYETQYNKNNKIEYWSLEDLYYYLTSSNKDEKLTEKDLDYLMKSKFSRNLCLYNDYNIESHVEAIPESMLIALIEKKSFEHRNSLDKILSKIPSKIGYSEKCFQVLIESGAHKRCLENFDTFSNISFEKIINSCSLAYGDYLHEIYSQVSELQIDKKLKSQLYELAFQTLSSSSMSGNLENIEEGKYYSIAMEVRNLKSLRFDDVQVRTENIDKAKKLIEKGWIGFFQDRLEYIEYFSQNDPSWVLSTIKKYNQELLFLNNFQTTITKIFNTEEQNVYAHKLLESNQEYDLKYLINDNNRFSIHSLNKEIFDTLPGDKNDKLENMKITMFHGLTEEDFQIFLESKKKIELSYRNFGHHIESFDLKSEKFRVYNDYKNLILQLEKLGLGDYITDLNIRFESIQNNVRGTSENLTNRMSMIEKFWKENFVEDFTPSEFNKNFRSLVDLLNSSDEVFQNGIQLMRDKIVSIKDCWSQYNGKEDFSATNFTNHYGNKLFSTDNSVVKEEFTKIYLKKVLKEFGIKTSNENYMNESIRNFDIEQIKQLLTNALGHINTIQIQKETSHSEKEIEELQSRQKELFFYLSELPSYGKISNEFQYFSNASDSDYSGIKEKLHNRLDTVISRLNIFEKLYSETSHDSYDKFTPNYFENYSIPLNAILSKSDEAFIQAIEEVKVRITILKDCWNQFQQNEIFSFKKLANTYGNKKLFVTENENLREEFLRIYLAKNLKSLNISPPEEFIPSISKEQIESVLDKIKIYFDQIESDKEKSQSAPEIDMLENKKKAFIQLVSYLPINEESIETVIRYAENVLKNSRKEIKTVSQMVRLPKTAEWRDVITFLLQNKPKKFLEFVNNAFKLNHLGSQVPEHVLAMAKPFSSMSDDELYTLFKKDLSKYSKITSFESLTPEELLHFSQKNTYKKDDIHQTKIENFFERILEKIQENSLKSANILLQELNSSENFTDKNEFLKFFNELSVEQIKAWESDPITNKILKNLRLEKQNMFNNNPLQELNNILAKHFPEGFKGKNKKITSLLESMSISMTDEILKYFSIYTDSKVKSLIRKQCNIENIDESLLTEEFFEAFKMMKNTTKNKEAANKIIFAYLNKQTFQSPESILTSYPLNQPRNIEFINKNFTQENAKQWYSENEKIYEIDQSKMGSNINQQIVGHLETISNLLKGLKMEETFLHYGAFLDFYKKLSKEQIEEWLSTSETANLFRDLKLQYQSIENIIKTNEARKINKIKIYHEVNPMKTLMMGNWVDGSCLSFYSNVGNYFSCFSNASDANKAVFYIEANGVVVGRVLTAINDSGKLIRFRMYYKGDVKIDLNEYFNTYIRELSNKCNIPLENYSTASTENVSDLLADTWYRDPIHDFGSAPETIKYVDRSRAA